MTPMQHEPDPQFISRLEDQLLTEHRRRERLGIGERQRRSLRPWLRGGGYLLTGLLIGCASMTTAQHIERSESLNELLRQSRANVDIAAQRLASSRDIQETLMNRWAEGTVVTSNSTLLSTRNDVAEAQTALQLAELDVVELEAGGDPSLKEITAPRTGGRDFFSARLQIESTAIAERTRYLEDVIEFTEARINAGVEVGRTLVPLTIERARLSAEAKRIAQTLELRRSFLDGHITADDAELRHRKVLADSRKESAQAQLDLLRADFEIIEQRFANGLVSDDQMATAEHDLLRIEAAVRVATLESDLIARRLAP